MIVAKAEIHMMFIISIYSCNLNQGIFSGILSGKY
jgi:hypothetical protein